LKRFRRTLASKLAVGDTFVGTDGEWEILSMAMLRGTGLASDPKLPAVDAVQVEAKNAVAARQSFTFPIANAVMVRA
jgi:hypothetical protein